MGIHNFAQTAPDTVHVSVAFSFFELKQKVEAVGHFCNKSSGDYLDSVTFPAVADAVDDVLHTSMCSPDSQTSFADLAVRVDLKICNNGGWHYHFHIVDSACAGEIVELEPRLHMSIRRRKRRLYSSVTVMMEIVLMDHPTQEILTIL